MAILKKESLIFIVDDHAYMCAMVVGLLTKLGYKNIEQFEDGRSCFYRLQQQGVEAPALVLLDWHMEDLDGYAFCDEVRKDMDVRMKQIPIIMVTGEKDKFLLEQVTDLGVKAILHKPVSLDELQNAIKAATPSRF